MRFLYLYVIEFILLFIKTFVIITASITGLVGDIRIK